MEQPYGMVAADFAGSRAGGRARNGVPRLGTGGEPAAVLRDARHIEDLQILAILLFGIAGLYSILFLVAPFLSAQVMKRQSDRTIACIKDQLRMTISELRELRVPAATSESGANSSQYRQLAGRIQYVNGEMAQVYRSLGVLFASRDVESARAHFYQALALSQSLRLPPRSTIRSPAFWPATTIWTKPPKSWKPPSPRPTGLWPRCWPRT